MSPEGKGSHLRLYGLILLMVLMWSANFIIGKYALREVPPLLVVGIRMIGSGLLMLPIYAGYCRRIGSAGWTRRDLPLLTGLGLMGVGLNQLLFVSGLSLTSVAHAAVMIGLTPMLVLLLAAWYGLERLSRTRLAGMLIALSGVGVLQVNSAGARGATFLGDMLIFGAGLTFAVFTVRGKATMGRVGGIVVNTFGYVGTGLALLPLTLYLSRNFDYGSVSLVAWASIFYMASFPSVIGYLIYYHALERIPASRLSAFAYLQPLIATLLAIPALGEYPSRSLLMGGLLVLAGVFVAERV